MKKIVVVGMTNNPGGVETYLMNFFASMHKKNEIIFINANPYSEIAYQSDIVSRGGKVFIAKDKYSLKHYIGRTRIARRILRKVKADIVYVNALSVYSAFWVKAAKDLGLPAVYHSHNDAIFRNRLELKKAASFFLKPYNQRILKYATCLSVSRDASKFMFNNTNATIVYNAIDIDKWKINQLERAKVRNKFGFKDNQKVIIIVSRLSKQKNVLRAIRILKKVIDYDETYRCLIVGNGILRDVVIDEIKKYQLEKYVQLLGKRNDIPCLMSGSDILLLPSLYEGLPFVVIEAQGSGLPIIASKDVIPKVADVTKSILEVSLDKSDDFWADEIRNMKLNSMSKRENMNQKVGRSYFSKKYYDKKIKMIFDGL
ncbi:hypothetical protein C5L30_001302 [Companilactobacillus farciminis]|uniref:Glycosyl transferase family 1 domain-containing protein n=1 Tax=Companilactobacillus farciminis TaxID=1612 RepID=A0A4R5NHW2_9LACO|nr:glycosyltransferase [Companilactobacillus farciminis]ATO45702.1 hypothetical protein LF20184_02535 [Companilactobacillus farciminis KCTC 3681 = DSM 20184]KRK62328.1 hypothetical protein FC68_GL002127 [Companilactobacillus farciminis KCTC 3681 = DSM 20184]TDG73810.1 hypothetical protein C5L30_001302 [Companilactobacillus farciminis]